MQGFSDELKQRKINLVANGYDAYCLFTMTGQEKKLANELNKEYDFLLATPMLKMAHRSKNGQKYDVEELMLSSYVFLYMPNDKKPFEIKSNYYSYKLLSYKNNNGKLVGGDLEYAKWVLENEGFLPVSKAKKVDGKVVIIDGPLKELEGYIVEYSKKNRNCCVELEFLNQKTKVWVPFEWIDIDLDQ